MKTFEVHITGINQEINKELDQLNIKNIIIDLLKPDGSLLRTEYMSSMVYKFESFSECKKHVLQTVELLKTKIVRVKIECPFYKNYLQDALYIESHFSPFNSIYPISKNTRSNKLLSTDRTYTKEEFEQFRIKWEKEEVELCLYDSNYLEDKDWFDLYG